MLYSPIVNTYPYHPTYQFELIMQTARRLLFILASSCVLLTSACAQELEEIKPATKKQTITATNMVLLKTSLGDIEIALDAEKAPKSVENFLSYVKDKHYDNTIFHRVIPGFMIQGGGFEPGMSQKPTKAPVMNEADNGLKNNKYTLAMARTQDPHSATAQFFINAKDNDFLNYTGAGAGWGYAVFGEVVNGKDVVDAIEKVQTGNVGPYGDVPSEDVVILSIEETQ